MTTLNSHKITNKSQDKTNIDELKKIVAEALRFAPEFIVHSTYREGCAPDSFHTSISCEESSIAKY